MTQLDAAKLCLKCLVIGAFGTRCSLCRGTRLARIRSLIPDLATLTRRNDLATRAMDHGLKAIVDAAVAEAERAAIVQVGAHAHWKAAHMARLLKVSTRTLYTKMHAYHLGKITQLTAVTICGDIPPVPAPDSTSQEEHP